MEDNKSNSKLSSMLIGLALGAVGASAAWYALVPKAPMNLAAPAPIHTLLADTTKVVCNAYTAKEITLAQATADVSAYLGAASQHLTYDGVGTLKGWFMERCIIEELFRNHPEADGLQLYVGFNSNKNNLIWMASKPEAPGSAKRENLIDHIVDMSEICPVMCPEKNDLP